MTSRKNKAVEVHDRDNPEWTTKDFRRAKKPEDVLSPDVMAVFKKRGPQKEPTKVPVSIRLSPVVIDHFKSKGPGWQSRIDGALRRVAAKEKYEVAYEAKKMGVTKDAVIKAAKKVTTNRPTHKGGPSAKKKAG